MYYPTYTMVICRVKSVIDVYIAIFDQAGENDMLFC